MRDSIDLLGVSAATVYLEKIAQKRTAIPWSYLLTIPGFLLFLVMILFFK